MATLKHTCEGQPEKALIAHPWVFREERWERDDCVEYGCAFAATVSKTLDGLQWCGPESGPYGEGPFYPTAESAKEAYDVHLLKKGWMLVDDLAYI